MTKKFRRDDKTSKRKSNSKPDDQIRGDLQRKKRRQYAMADNPETTLVGANLPTYYARRVAFFHAETGKSKKKIMQEALDMYFTAMANRHVGVL